MNLQALTEARNAAKAALVKHPLTAQIQRLTEEVAARRAKRQPTDEVQAELDALKAERANAVELPKASAALSEARRLALEAATKAASEAVAGLSDTELEAELHRLTAARRELKAKQRAVVAELNARAGKAKVAKILSELTAEDKARLLAELAD